jgi:GNAT superfamily N-acetyltransferase
MDDEALARLEHDNMHDWLRVAAGQVPGAVIHRADGVGLYATGLPAPLFNQIVTDDEAEPAEVAAAVQILRDRQVPFCAVLRRDADERLRPLMTELALALDRGVLPGMALHPMPTDLATSARGLEIEVVRDARSLREHALVAAHAFGIREDVAIAFVGEELWTRSGATVYLGRSEGRPVVSGFSLRTGDTLGIFTIATEADARGRGFGGAMTSRLIADGAAAGCTVAALQASDMGRPIYERIGFRVVQEYDVYVGRPA